MKCGDDPAIRAVFDLLDEEYNRVARAAREKRDEDVQRIAPRYYSHVFVLLLDMMGRRFGDQLRTHLLQKADAFEHAKGQFGVDSILADAECRQQNEVQFRCDPVLRALYVYCEAQRWCSEHTNAS